MWRGGARRTDERKVKTPCLGVFPLAAAQSPISQRNAVDAQPQEVGNPALRRRETKERASRERRDMRGRPRSAPDRAALRLLAFSGDCVRRHHGPVRSG